MHCQIAYEHNYDSMNSSADAVSNNISLFVIVTVAAAGTFSGLTWTEVEGRFGYQVYRYADGNDSTVTPPHRQAEDMLR